MYLANRSIGLARPSRMRILELQGESGGVRAKGVPALLTLPTGDTGVGAWRGVARRGAGKGAFWKRRRVGQAGSAG